MSALLDKLRTALGGSLREIAVHVAALATMAAGFCSLAAHALPAHEAVTLGAIGAGLLAVDRIALAFKAHLSKPAAPVAPAKPAPAKPSTKA